MASVIETLDFTGTGSGAGDTFDLTLTLDSAPSNSGTPLTGISGTVTGPNGGTITQLDTTYPVPYGGPDNLLYDAKPYVDSSNGISFDVGTSGDPDQVSYNLFDNGGTPEIVYDNNFDDYNVKYTAASFCFFPGTQIRTPDGEVAVESLKRGDLVTTREGDAVPVSWLGVQTVSMRFADPLRVLPIRIKAGALDENVPARDLLLSPDHAVLIGDVLFQAAALVNGTSIVRETNVSEVFTYYHVEVDDHALILAENTPAETFIDNVDRMGFDNWAEHEALYPEGKPMEELPYPRAKAHRQVSTSTRAMLADRAKAIGAAADDAA